MARAGPQAAAEEVAMIRPKREAPAPGFDQELAVEAPYTASDFRKMRFFAQKCRGKLSL